MLKQQAHSYTKLGHLIFSPSSHRMYSSSAMGDFRDEAMESSLFAEVGSAGVECPESDIDGRPVTSSCTSVTTRPWAVISLLRMIRL